MPKLRTPRLIAAALAVPLLLGTLSACGTTDDAPDAGGTADSGTESFETFEDYQLAFAACMRDQGIDMPDPNSDGSVGGIEAQAGDGFVEAAGVCQDELGEPPAAPGAGPSMSDEEMRAESLEIAACFRDNGFEVPDPGPGESLTLPMDVPDDVFEECAPNGIMGSTGVGGS
jgi:hypothetical protein